MAYKLSPFLVQQISYWAFGISHRVQEFCMMLTIVENGSKNRNSGARIMLWFFFFFFSCQKNLGGKRYLTKKWHEFNYSLFWEYDIVCSPVNQERKLSRKLRIPCREHRMQLKNLNRDGKPLPRGASDLHWWYDSPHPHSHHSYHLAWTKDSSSRSSISKVKTDLPTGLSWVYYGAKSQMQERGRMGAKGTGVPP